MKNRISVSEVALTTNYLCNEWLDKADLQVFERMKKNNPRRYAVAGLGGWGIVDGLVYENWKEQASEENLDVRYGKLKTDHDAMIAKDAESQKLIAELQKATKGQEDVQTKITEYADK